MSDKTVVRGGYGLFWAPWAYGANNSVGYSATTNMAQPNNIPAINIVDPFPSGLIPVSGNSRGLLSGISSDISFVDPNKTAPYVHQYSIDVQRELVGNLSGSVAYIGSTGRRLTTAGNVNINQVDPKYLPLGSALTQTVPNPVLRQPERRHVRVARDHRAQSAAAPVPAVPQRQPGGDEPRQVAVPRRRDSDPQAHDVVERQLQLHLQPPAGQPVRPGQLLHRRAGPAESLHASSRARATSIPTRSTDAA